MKALSWRAAGTVDTTFISFIVTGHIRWALTIGLVELFTKLTLYYLHERVWERISFGREKAISEDFQI